MQHPTNKYGEHINHIYQTTWGVRLAVPESEAMYYFTIGTLRKYNRISSFCHRSAEAFFVWNGWIHAC